MGISIIVVTSTSISKQLFQVQSPMYRTINLQFSYSIDLNSTNSDEETKIKTGK